MMGSDEEEEAEREDMVGKANLKTTRTYNDLWALRDGFYIGVCIESIVLEDL